MNPGIFTERLRGVIAGYFLSSMLVFLIALVIAGQFVFRRTVDWSSLRYLLIMLSAPVLTGFIAYWLFYRKPFAEAVAIVYLILQMITEEFGVAGYGIAPGTHSRAPAIYHLIHLPTLVIMGLLFWLKRRDKTDDVKESNLPT